MVCLTSPRHHGHLDAGHPVEQGPRPRPLPRERYLLLARTVLIRRENGTYCSRERYLLLVRTVLIRRENGGALAAWLPTPLPWGYLPPGRGGDGRRPYHGVLSHSFSCEDGGRCCQSERRPKADPRTGRRPCTWARLSLPWPPARAGRRPPGRGSPTGAAGPLPRGQGSGSQGWSLRPPSCTGSRRLHEFSQTALVPVGAAPGVCGIVRVFRGRAEGRINNL